MARGRMISKSLSTSKKRARLHGELGPLAEFAQNLYPLLVAHADDFGRQEGDAFSVKHRVDPSSPRGLDDFERAITGLVEVGLIVRYDAGGRVCLQIVDFDRHQSGLQKRTVSGFAEPPGGDRALCASERTIEEHVADELLAGQLRIEPLTVTTLDRQVRIENSYIDILAQTAEAQPLTIEIKRQRVTRAALDQVLSYAQRVPKAVPVLIGYGVAAGLDLAATGVLVGTYGDDGVITTAASLHVLDRSLTFNHVKATRARAELNLTKENLTKEVRTGALAFRGTPLVRGPNPATAFDGPRVHVPHKLHDEFLRRRDHGDRAATERELLAWYESVSETWTRGARQRDEPGGDMWAFWRARYDEQWPASPKQKHDRRPTWVRR